MHQPNELEPIDMMETASSVEQALAGRALAERGGSVCAYVLTIVDEGDAYAVNIGSAGPPVDMATMRQIREMLHRSIDEQINHSVRRSMAQ